MSFYAYRINGGEVIGMSESSYAFPGGSKFAEIENPTETDGRGLSPAKIKDGSAIRNATAQEIAAFVTAAAADDKSLILAASKLHLDDANFAEPIARAIAELVLDEINLLRQWTDDYKAQVAAATSLANLQSRVAGIAQLSQRTKNQLITAIKNKIDALS